MKGRRLPDTEFGELPNTDLLPGDYWKCTRPDGAPMQAQEAPQNLTGTVWQVVAPFEEPPHAGVATLMQHTVREHEDGTISVRPNDGSSNSILITGAHNKTWHGYINHGVWEEA